jgi:hypothetical protein
MKPIRVLNENEETGCCKRFNPSPWIDKEVNFNDRQFIKDHVISFFHIPLNYGKVMKRNMDEIENAGAKAEKPLMLSDENSLFGSDVFIAVDKPIPGRELVRMPGNFLSRVFEGPFSNMGKWVKEMNEYVMSKGKKSKKLYFFYPTCPACAKAYGKNYVVLLAEI